MPIARLIYVAVPPQEAAEAERIWKEDCAPLMIKRPGCLREELLQCREDKGEFISMVKMTSIVGYIAVQDLTKASDIIRSRTFDAFFPLILVAILYFVIAWLLTLALERIEIMTNSRRRRKVAA